MAHSIIKTFLFGALFAAGYAHASPNSALTFNTPGANVLHVQGVLARDGADQLAQALDQNPNVRNIEFNSVGGSYLAGIAMGQLIRQRGLDTSVGTGMMCQSACVYALAGGVKRTIAPHTIIGLHSHGDNNWGQHFNLSPTGGQDTYLLNNNGIAYVVGNALLMAREGAMHLRKMDIQPEVMELILANPSHGGRVCVLARPCALRWGLDNQSRLSQADRAHTCGLGDSLLTSEGLKTRYSNGRYTGPFAQACTEQSY